MFNMAKLDFKEGIEESGERAYYGETSSKKGGFIECGLRPSA